MKFNRMDLMKPANENLIAMIEGNPGAMTVCLRLMGRESGDDPMDTENTEEMQKFAEGYGDIFRLDLLKIYGSDIWVCYKDLCQMNIELLRMKIRDESIRKELDNCNTR